jgi:hypothetical protein
MFAANCRHTNRTVNTLTLGGKLALLNVALLGLCPSAPAQAVYTVTSTADAFLATGSPSNPAGTNLTSLNFGAAGALVIASATSVKGEFQSVLKFDLSGASNLFNTTYGTNNWMVGGFSLQLTSNNGIAGTNADNPIFPTVNGGQFVIEWLSNNNWVEGDGTPKLPDTNGVTYDSLPDLLSGAHEILCTNTYTPPGNNVPVIYDLPLDTNLVAAVSQGGEVTFLFYAADDQIGYLFNSHEFGGSNKPLLHVTANPPPLKLLSGFFTNGNFQLTGVGGGGLQYQIQATADLGTTNWQIIGIITADSAGMIQFDDTNASNQLQRFYRLSR